MKRNISPEEKLLGLIKGNSQGAVMSPPKAGLTVSPQRPAPAHLSSAQAVALFKDSVYSLVKSLTVMVGLRRFLTGLLIISAFYCLLNFIYPFFMPREIKLPAVKPAGASLIKTPDLDEKTSAYYLEPLAGKQIFGDSAAVSGGNMAMAGADVVKDLLLVGVITGDNPQAVVQDKKTQQTFYLRKGQLIGELQLEEILEGKVIFLFRGQRFELYM